jgi:DNA-directed RNA polymerase subunit RPC12/RpoP
MKKETQIEKPKYLMNYWCLECGAQTLLTDLDEPYCDACQRNRRLVILTKEKYTLKNVDEKIKIVNAYIIFELEKSLSAGNYEKGDDRESTKLKLFKAKMLKKLLESKKLSGEEIEKFLN